MCAAKKEKLASDFDWTAVELMNQEVNEWMYHQDEMWNVGFLGILCSESLIRIQGSKE